MAAIANGAGTSSLRDYVTKLEQLAIDKRGITKAESVLLAGAAYHGLHAAHCGT